MRHLLLALLGCSACLSPANSTALGGTGAVTFDDRVALLDTAPVCAAASPGALFVDTTETWALEQVRGNRLTVADLDGDGYPDLVVHAVSSNVRQLQQPDGGARLVWQLMNRKGPDGLRRFVDETGNGLFQVRDGSETHFRAAHLAVFGDVDNDGDLDAFSGTYDDPSKSDIGDRSELMLNDGTGHFSLAAPTPVRGSASERLPTTSATFTDADRDGKLDLFVGYFYEYYGRTYQGLRSCCSVRATAASPKTPTRLASPPRARASRPSPTTGPRTASPAATSTMTERPSCSSARTADRRTCSIATTVGGASSTRARRRASRVTPSSSTPTTRTSSAGAR